MVSLQVDGESVNEAPPETAATNNTFNRYGIGDTVILGRPEYAFNDRTPTAETALAPRETVEAMPFAMPAAIPTSFIPAPALQSDPAPVFPDQTDLASSGLEPATPISTKPLEKTDATPPANSSTSGANGYNLSAAPPVPRDCADYKAARAFGAAHGYSEIKTEKFAALLHYQDPQNRVDYCDSLKNSPDQISIFLDLVPTNADGTFNLAAGQRIMDERLRAPAFPNDPDAGNRFRDNNRVAGRDFLGGPDIARAPDIPRAGAGQGAQDYANEMTMAAPGYGYSYDYDDRSNSYDSPDSTYDDPGSTPQTDFDPLPSLPPVDSNGPMMLPPPDVRVDRELAPIPNIGVTPGAERTPAPQYADAAQTWDRTALGDPTRDGSTRTNTGQGGAVIGTQPGNDATVSDPVADASRPLYGFNADGQPLFSSGSKPPQGEYRAAPDAPSLMAGDPVLRADATGATPLRDENGTLYYRVNGGSMDGQIIYVQTNVQPTAPTPQTEQPAITLETGGTADRSGDLSLGFAPLALGSTATSRLGAQLASQVLAAEMEFGPPQLRLAAAATLTGAALWAAGRQNTEYEALSPEELDRLRQPLINVSPPPLPPLPGLVPPPVPDNSTLPGTPTDKPIRPIDLSNPIPQPQNWQDLIVTNGNADNNRSRAQDRYAANPNLTDPSRLLGTQVPGVGTWIAPPTPRGDKGADYEEQITGTPSGIELNVGGTIRTTPNGTPTASGGANFEGVRTEGNTTVLIDAKDWSNFLPEGQGWWVDQVNNEARAQLDAIGGLGNVRIEWVVSSQQEADAVIRALERDGYEDDIDVVVVPKKGN
jgi:hypothetical protein